MPICKFCDLYLDESDFHRTEVFRKGQLCADLFLICKKCCLDLRQDHAHAQRCPALLCLRSLLMLGSSVEEMCAVLQRVFPKNECMTKQTILLSLVDTWCWIKLLIKVIWHNEVRFREVCQWLVCQCLCWGGVCIRFNPFAHVSINVVGRVNVYIMNFLISTCTLPLNVSAKCSFSMLRVAL